MHVSSGSKCDLETLFLAPIKMVSGLSTRRRQQALPNDRIRVLRADRGCMLDESIALMTCGSAW